MPRGKGTGSKRKRAANRWELRYKGHSKVVTAGSATAAERALAEYRVTVDNPIPEKPEQPSIGELVDRYVKLSRGLEKSTWAEYDRLTRRRILPRWATVTTARPSEFSDWYYELVEEGLKPGSVGKIHGLIHAALNSAVSEDLIPLNYATRARLPTGPKYEATIPSRAQVQELMELSEAHSPEMGVAVAIAALTGLRPGEICGFHWSRIDLETGRVVVARSIGEVWNPTHEVYEKDTKTKSIRTKETSEAMRLRLSEHRLYVVERMNVANVDEAEDGYVISFDIAGEAPIPPRLLSRRFARLRDKAGIRCRMYDLRHHYASVLLNRGIDVRTVQHELGHAQATHTLNTYAHVLPGASRQAADTFADYLTPATQSE